MITNAISVDVIQTESLDRMMSELQVELCSPEWIYRVCQRQTGHLVHGWAVCRVSMHCHHLQCVILLETDDFTFRLEGS